MRVSGGSGLIEAYNNEKVEKQTEMASRGELDAGPSFTRMEETTQSSESIADTNSGTGGLDFFKSAFDSLTSGVSTVVDFFKELFSPSAGGADQSAAGTGGGDIGKGIMEFAKTAFSAVGSGLGMAVDLLKKVLL